MIYKLRAIIISVMIVALAGQQSTAEINADKNSGQGSKGRYKNRRLLVRYKDGTSTNKKDNIHFSVGAYVVRAFEVPKNLEVVEVAKGISLDAAEEFYREDPNVLYVERDEPLHAFLEPPPTDPLPPDDDPPPDDIVDPRYAEQWALHNTGQDGGTPDVDINAPELWEGHTIGDPGIIIAVIDTGVNYSHPDLKNNMWVNPGEIPNNNIDDDMNGVVDDVHGFNALDNHGDPMDDNGHGSHCAGIIAAEGQNYFGGRGVMQRASIVACKFLDGSGTGSTASAIACLDYLRDLKTRAENPVDILLTSNSWGGGAPSEALEDAIRAHQELGILFVAAAGNDGSDNDVSPTYPANYPLANIVSVAATNSVDDVADFSNVGKRSVHVGAPGVEILSTVLENEYEFSDGTSMAAPFVAGLAGMIKLNNPDLNYMRIKNLLMTGGVPIAGLAGKSVSGRRIRAVDINGLGSLTCQNQFVAGRLSPTIDRLLVAVGQKVILSALNINCAEPNGDIIIPSIPGNNKYKLKDDGAKNIDSAAGDGTYTHEWIAEAPGKYEFMFPENDKVTVNVYDPSILQAYKATPEETFQYRYIEGIPLDAADDGISSIDLPFPVHFGSLAQGFDFITIGSNGAVSITNTDSIDLNNVALPVSKYISLIAPFWDDLNPSADEGDIFYDVVGEAPNRELVIEWRKVRHYNSFDTATFEIVFFENSADILFNYLDVDFGDPSLNNGASATIGIQSTEAQFVQVGFDSPSVQSNTGIRFTLTSAP